MSGGRAGCGQVSARASLKLDARRQQLPHFTERRGHRFPAPDELSLYLLKRLNLAVVWQGQDIYYALRQDTAITTGRNAGDHGVV